MPCTFEAFPSVVHETKIGYKIYKRDTTVVVLTAKEGEKWNLINSKEHGSNICTLKS